MRIRQRHSLWGVPGPMVAYQRELILNWHRSNGAGSHRLVQSSGESSVAADVGAQSPKACIRRVKSESESEDLAARELVVGGKRGAEELDGDLEIAEQGSFGSEDDSAMAVSKEVESEECGRGYVAKKPRLAQSEDGESDVPEVRSGNKERDDRGKHVAGDVPSDSVKEEDDGREIEKGTVLLQAMHQVFAGAGSRGLTVRKAVDLIVEAGLAGFKEDGAAERAAVGKIVRESPTFTRLTRKTFALLSAFPEDNRPSLWTSSPHVPPESMDDGEEMCNGKGENVKSKSSGGEGLSQAARMKRMRKGTKVRRMGCITRASPEGSGQGAASETKREPPSSGTRTTDWVNVRSTTPELQEHSSPSHAEWSKIRVEVVSAEVPAPVPQSVQGDEACETPDDSAVTMLEERFSDSRSDGSHLGGLSAHMTHPATEDEPASPMNGPDTILATIVSGPDLYKPCVSKEATQASLRVKDYAGEPLHTVTVDQANEPSSLLEGPETVITEVEECGQTRGSTRPLDDCSKQETVPECRTVKVVSAETQSPPSLKETAVALTNELLGVRGS